MTNTIATNPSVIASQKAGVLSLAIKEKSSLHSAYMPFVEGGRVVYPHQ